MTNFNVIWHILKEHLIIIVEHLSDVNLWMNTLKHQWCGSLNLQSKQQVESQIEL